jgi:hypothetical protein
MRGHRPYIFLASVLLAACSSRVTTLVGEPPPGQVIDSFNQQSLVKADILWVVDNSGSMAREQAQLATAFPSFFKWLEGSKVDYRIGITTSDLGSKAGDPGNAGNFIGGVIVGNSQDPAVSNTPDPQTAFATAILVGTQGSAHDQSQEAALRALVRQAQLANQAISANQSVLFLRPDAALFIIFVSDGFDYSPGDYEYYWRAYHQAKGIGNDNLILVSAIAGDYPNGCDVPDAGHIDPGIHLYQLVTRSAGVFGSICDSQFDETLSQIGIQAVGLQHRFHLSNPADPTTIQVEIRYPCATDANVDPHLANCLPPITVQCPSGMGSACTGASCSQVTDSAQEVCRSPPSAQSGWTYEPTDQTLVFNGSAGVPGLGSVVVVTYTLAGFTGP